MDAIFTLTAFTPAEATAITGVSQDLQRDWRRRGFLPRSEGHARFDLFGLAELLTMKLLSARDIGPKAAAEVADWCGNGIAYHALDAVDAYEGDHLRTNEARGLDDRPLSDDERSKLATLISQTGGRYDAPDVRWGDKADWLRRQVYHKRTGTRVIPGSLFAWWADDSHSFLLSLDEALADMLSGDPRLAGPIVVLDLQALAYTLSERAGRAFVHVEFPNLPPIPGA
ncbi:helix-turn-helix domain-containing protein [Novosphingobium sp. LASN5T]|uniref:helix-turn-helix domain-containing protein n=1 Tax=Novosphingobium sp. LASN5T TaxID=2491021 RepID=UPI000F5F7D46|nr:helix-turn-helix domain-containing protein [Novosphingobium sp. LASN5T]RQW41376.1 hypothetical protein EH199_19495 [Novosphingobium sp. LASN5T]